MNGNIYQITKETIEKYSLISSGDSCLLGVSGGKDSLVCLSVLENLSHELNFFLSSVFVSYPMKTLPAETEKYIKSLTDLYTADIDTEENLTCSLCAKKRRIAILETAKKYGFGKIILAHTREDCAETVLLNLFSGKGLENLEPKRIYFDKYTLIRPFIHMPEKKIISFAERNSLPVCQNTCKNLSFCGRIKIRNTIKDLEEKFPNIRENILRTGKNR